MLEFPVKWDLRYVQFRQNTRSNRIRCLLNLNDEWTIIFPLSRSVNNTFIWNTIIIKRKNTDGEFLISVDLAYKRDINLLFKVKFSQYIKTGSSFIEAPLCHEVEISRTQDSLLGFMTISGINEISPSSLAKMNSKEIIYLRSLEKLSKDLQQILDPSSSCISDVSLKCGSVSIPAHKGILSARSPVFSAMFAIPMKESHENEVDITDIDESTLRALLMYIYTGKTSDLTASSAEDLLFAADKYQLPNLKTVCSHFLKDIVSSENVWRTLVLGDMHDENLKSFAMDYICNKCNEFSDLENTQEWKALRKDRPDLSVALLEYLVKLREEKLKQQTPNAR